jgi:hypothetical protein
LGDRIRPVERPDGDLRALLRGLVYVDAVKAARPDRVTI